MEMCTGYPPRIFGEQAKSSTVEELSGLRKESYITTLSDDLFQKSGGRQLSYHMVGKLSDILPGLLRAFALGFGNKESSQIHRNLMVFIHTHR